MGRLSQIQSHVYVASSSWFYRLLSFWVVSEAKQSGCRREEMLITSSHENRAAQSLAESDYLPPENRPHFKPAHARPRHSQIFRQKTDKRPLGWTEYHPTAESNTGSELDRLLPVWKVSLLSPRAEPCCGVPPSNRTNAFRAIGHDGLGSRQRRATLAIPHSMKGYLDQNDQVPSGLDGPRIHSTQSNAHDPYHQASSHLLP